MINKKPNFILLFLLISFGSITAVLFTPALPQISEFFAVSDATTQWTISLFLVGYAVGQLLYGPLANGYGRKVALYIGIITEIVASILCILSGTLHSFWLLIVARLLMALGASVGLKMTFTLLSDCYAPEEVTRKTSHLMVAFAITPGVGVTIGGFLTEFLGWQSCFYFLALYGVFLLFLCSKMQETALKLDADALKLTNVIDKYSRLLKNKPLILGAVLMGCGTAVVYLFAAMAPFVTEEFMHLTASEYGLWSLLPPLGIVAGSQCAAYLTQHLRNIQAIKIGLGIMLLGFIFMTIMLSLQQKAIWLFLPLAVMYIGMTFIFPNASFIAMQSVTDKASGSAMMSFINMGIATVGVLLVSTITITTPLMIPLTFAVVLLLAWMMRVFLRRN